jgi:hypothetical protein
MTLDDNIESFDLSTRLRRALILNQISTPRDILRNVEKLFNTSQLGQKSFSEIDMILESLDIESNLSTTYQKRILKPTIKRMKLEIIKETKFNEPTWYILKVDGFVLQCSKRLEEVEDLYEQIKNNPELAKEERVILKSEEI